MRTCCTGLNLDGPSVSRCCCPQPKLNSLLTHWAKKVTLSGPPVDRSDCYLSPARPACVQSEPSNCDPSQQNNNNKATVILNHLQAADHSPFAGSLFRFSPFALLLCTVAVSTSEASWHCLPLKTKKGEDEEQR